MKNFLFGLLFLTGFTLQAQVYNNEWIDYNKTYYKFKVGKTGLYRISQATLSSTGLGGASAEEFQLWRNGVQIPIYTSVANGTLSTSDYIEFWGEMNDGKPDRQLYRQPDYQLNDKWSLETDTAAYFLTLNPGSTNLRLTATSNNVATNTLPAEPYFMHTAGNYFKNRINAGYAVNVGQYLYSSSYDKGEGWSSADIGTNGINTLTFSNLFVYTGGPEAKFKIAVSGNAINPRTYKAVINTDTIFSKEVDYFNYSTDSINFPLSIISSNSATVKIINKSLVANDRMVVHKYEMTYPRQFNFGGAKNFDFLLPANTNGNYLEIQGFSYGVAIPILYDLTNGRRYEGDISTATKVKFLLEPSNVERKLLLVNEETANINYVNEFQQKLFINYSLAQNAADYIIISHPQLLNAANGSTPVEEYKAYRNSTEGGSFNANIFLINDIIDQFGFGIKQHPVAVRNFLMFARVTFPTPIKNVFLIGKGITYVEQRANESKPDVNRLNFIPTFGNPASDILLSADPGDGIPQIPIGRLSVINAEEIAVYLKKVKEHELNQRTMSPYIRDKAWMKNVAHIVGASEPALQRILDTYMNSYKNIIQDTLFGANVTTFTKSSPNAVEQVNSGVMDKLFEEGISLMTYFGHSSVGTLEFNLNDPDQYHNQGKYPIFLALGCNAGNFYTYNTARLSVNETLSEKYVLAPDRGTIGFIASSHFGIVHYLDISTTREYESIANTNYGETIGQIMKSTVTKTFDFTTQDDFYARAQCEEMSLHGDPAVKINAHSKPDYVIEDQLLAINPGFISVADNSFKVRAKFLNIGKAINQNIAIQIKREYPDKTSEIIFRDTIPGILFSDSLQINVPINPIRDKGSNKITISLDADESVDELFETNNSVTRELFIYDDEARPVFPYDLSIVNNQNIKLIASTANPLSKVETYRMEIDTTEKFNSPIKSTNTITSGGGILEFTTGINFSDSTVYYWRVARVKESGIFNWSNASFIYIPGQIKGFNQSHFDQHLQSKTEGIFLDSVSKQWQFSPNINSLFIRNGSWVTSSGQEINFSLSVNGDNAIANTCAFSSIVFNVFDPISFKPWVNTTTSGTGLYNSWSNTCSPTRKWNFEYRYTDTSSRRKAMDFMQQTIPDGSYVVVRSFALDPVRFPTFPQAFVADWMKDTTIYGSGKSLYHYLKNAGLSSVDSFYKVRPFILVYKKNDPSFTPKWMFGVGNLDNITLPVNCNTPGVTGFITSPVFGPSKKWNELRWNGSQLETSDDPEVNVIGITSTNQKDTLFHSLKLDQQVVNISNIDAKVYPYLQLHMKNKDSVNASPYQLKKWSVTYTPAPEGAVAANLYYSPLKDSLEVGEPSSFKIAFKNVSDQNFDSLKLRVVLTDDNNVPHILLEERRKPLIVGDTIRLDLNIDSKKYSGFNYLLVDFNPDNDQPEQYRFNNFVYQNLYVKGDTLNPVLDVTFDNSHILNGDIVSSKPDILIKLKDEARWLLLNDTSVVKIQVRYPDNTIRDFNFNSDTLQFNPAQDAPNGDNTASINFKPYFEEDGDYELIVSAKDKSNNSAGNMEYKVGFQVINKAMISNMLNYPNPFTTSTAFVFTITGSEVPQNIKIQILTVTGKIVREITKDELGPLRIGRNITEYKWNGTDQYGQKLANGIYLYRVVTNLNGKSLEKYKSSDDDTEKYFNKGYGKMYLMR